jgi:dihydroflavonol-4-reductase
MLLQVASGKALIAPGGGNSFADARDVAAGILAAAAKGRTGQRYILAGTQLSYFECWRLLARLTGGRPPLIRVGPVARIAGGLGGDLWRRLAGQEPDINSAAIQMASLVKDYSSQRAITELGYSIRPLEETVRDAWQWFLDHGYVHRRGAIAAGGQVPSAL